jgi:predicted nucleic acid-binding protein
MIVVDASVVAKWFLPETGTEKAMALLEGPHPLIAPTLVRLEVYSAITRRQRMAEIQKDEAVLLCEKWSERLRQGTITLVPDVEILDLAVAQALKLSHSLADCLYLAVAELRSIPLITADPNFQKKAVKHHSDTHLLSHWQSN